MDDSVGLRVALASACRLFSLIISGYAVAKLIDKPLVSGASRAKGCLAASRDRSGCHTWIQVSPRHVRSSELLAQLFAILMMVFASSVAHSACFRSLASLLCRAQALNLLQTVSDQKLFCDAGLFL